MTEIGTDRRVVDGVATAWFDAPSLTEGAALAGRIVDLSTEIVVDLRATGVRVRLDSDARAEAVSASAWELGLAANPAVLQHLSVVFESANPSAVSRFWQHELDYAPAENGGLADPLRRDPRSGSGSRPSHGRCATASTSTWCGRNRPGAGRGARRGDRDSRPLGGVQRDGVLPHHLADAAA